ncbi:MAG: hypothetical protein C0627_09430 [Sulfurimonas sp.]|nr:MAG: hypothetical protein C0627_09430 [Sulfurimonas sp.]
MKTTLILLLAIFLSNSFYADELKWVDEQIEAIKPPRRGVNIATVGDPFVFLEKNKTEVKDTKKGTKSTIVSAKKTTLSAEAGSAVISTPKKSSFILSAIINSSAMIDGSWYKISDKISSYTVTDITKTSVTLKSTDKELILSTAIKNQNLKFKNK